MHTDDLILTCADCGETFALSGGEQQFFASRGLQQPRRCKPCRAERTRQRDVATAAAEAARVVP